MKKIIFSVALLNISLIFSAPAKPEAKTKSSNTVHHLTKEEHKKASSEAIKCDYILIDAILTNYPAEIDKKSLKDKDYKYVTKKDSECRKEGKNYTYDCISKIDTIIHKYFLTVNPEIYNNWQDCICGKNNSRGYSFCEKDKPIVNPKSRLKSQVKK